VRQLVLQGGATNLKVGVNALEGGEVNTVKTLTFEIWQGCMTPSFYGGTAPASIHCYYFTIVTLLTTTQLFGWRANFYILASGAKIASFGYDHLLVIVLSQRPQNI